jgi:hypothetical protein
MYKFYDQSNVDIGHDERSTRRTSSSGCLQVNRFNRAATFSCPTSKLPVHNLKYKAIDVDPTQAMQTCVLLPLLHKAWVLPLSPIPNLLHASHKFTK